MIGYIIFLRGTLKQWEGAARPMGWGRGGSKIMVFVGPLVSFTYSQTSCTC